MTRVTSPLTAQVPLNPESGDLGEKWPLNFADGHYSSIHACWVLLHADMGPAALLPLQIFITLKNPSPSVRIEPAPSGKHANH
jgi:hypothetical protein